MEYIYIWGPFAFFGLFISAMVWAEVLTAKGYDEIRRDKRMASALEKMSNMKEAS